MDEIENHKFFFAVKAAVAGSIGGLLFGYDLGVISGALPLLASQFSLTIWNVDVLVGIMAAGSVLGAAVGGEL